jgi:hypothetical protein
MKKAAEFKHFHFTSFLPVFVLAFFFRVSLNTEALISGKYKTEVFKVCLQSKAFLRIWSLALEKPLICFHED